MLWPGCEIWRRRFYGDRQDALVLAETLVSIGEESGKETIAYLTNMHQPLGYKIGNWLEVEESVESLQGKGPDDVMKVTHMLAGTMIMLGGVADSVDEGIEKSKAAVQNGQAFEKWLEVTEEQGGDIRVLKQLDDYPPAKFNFSIEADKTGYIQEVNAYKIGIAALELGAGRKKKEDDVDPSAGIVLKHKTGAYVKKGETLATGFTNNNEAIKIAGEIIGEAFSIDEKKLDILQ